MTTSQAIDQLRLVLRRQHKALPTEKSYIFWLRRYIAALFRMPRNLPSNQKLERFLSNLARDRDVSASTQNQAFNALLFFYRDVPGKTLGNVNALRAQRPVHERHTPTLAQTQSLLSTIGNEGGYPTNLIARFLYGCGLRVTEPLNLRIKDIDLQRRSLCIRGAKGGHDRVVPLPASLIPELTQQIQVARAVWQRDQPNRTPLMLPHRLARKYPDYRFRWGWAWLFPAHHPCRDPWTATRVRFRMHEANVQRAVKKAAHQLGISVLPHELRHAYASHCLARGTNPRAIQQVMGHKSLETTMGYFHADALSVSSPLDALPVILPFSGEPAPFLKVPELVASEVRGSSRRFHTEPFSKPLPSGPAPGKPVDPPESGKRAATPSEQLTPVSKVQVAAWSIRSEQLRAQAHPEQKSPQLIRTRIAIPVPSTGNGAPGCHDSR